MAEYALQLSEAEAGRRRREAMQAEGHALTEDVARWGAALDRLDREAARPVAFLPRFWALGRRTA